MNEIEDACGIDDADGTRDRMATGGSLWKEVRPLVGQIAFACHGDRLRRAARVVTSIYDDALEPVQIRLPQLTLLAHVWEAGPGGVGVVELARRMAMDRSSVSRAAGIVLRKKMVERGYRSRAFRLTPQGCDVVAAALPH
jgi:DNA-binding MarR family transcriptional regulator